MELTVANRRAIERACRRIVHALKMSQDREVIDVSKQLAVEEALQRIEKTDEVAQFLEPLLEAKTEVEVSAYEALIERYTKPFPSLTNEQLRNMWKKEKKLKVPNVELVDWGELVYFTWKDMTTRTQYIVAHDGTRYVTVKGTIGMAVKDGICAICNEPTETRSFTVTHRVKGQQRSQTNAICANPTDCNARLADEQRLHRFIERQQKR